MHIPATSAEVPERKSTPPSLCRLQDDAIGVCVAYYLCKNGKLDTQGGGLLERRTVDGCSGSHVCCPFNTQGVTDPPPVATTRPPTPPPKPTTRPAQPDVCLKDGEIGLCVTADHCATSKLFGGNHIATREVTTTPVTQSGEEIDPTSTCGTRDNGETPWLVIVKDLSNVSESGNTYAGSVGGGTLIHPSVVLTTAHTVRGKRDLQVIARGDETQTRDVDSVVMHEDFSKANLRNDIALLFLFEPMRLSRRVRVACLSVAAATAPARCEAIEWAHSSPEQKAIATIDVPLLIHQDCQSKFRRTRLGWFFELNESFMCAGGERATIRCKGDGGFPLICPDENGSRFVQFGVTAWDIDCGRHGNPIAYVRVAHFRGWIDRNMLLKGLSTNTYDYNNQEPYYN
nr:phenoloxidase-activating factor 2-like [Maniola hyperantus]